MWSWKLLQNILLSHELMSLIISRPFMLLSMFASSAP
jgi:hypothetical protein